MRKLAPLGALLMVGSASAAPVSVTGLVVDSRSHWTADGSRIVTDTTIQTDTGDAVVVRTLGGKVGGLGMVTFPATPELVVGMQVALAAHPALDLSQQTHLEVDAARVLAVPEGFVRSGPTDAGHYLYWESGCVFVTYDAAGTSELDGDSEFGLIDASIATWNNDTASCSYLQVMKQEVRDAEVGKDEINVIKFRDTLWGRPATTDDPGKMYPTSAAGITTVTYINDPSTSRDGAIVDADVEINGVNFAIADNGMTLSSNPILAELQNTMTHEIGHLHGLEHTCLADYEMIQRLDDKGNPVPKCSATSDPTIVEATMYPYQDSGETKKETLEPDDINAICTIYPTAKDPGTCAAVDLSPGCGCRTDSSPGGLAGLATLAGVVGLVLRRRKRILASPRQAH